MKYFDVVFASSGDLTAVPDAIQSSGSISYTQGWGPYYSQDPTVDPSTALLIDRAQTNQLFNDLTGAVQQYQQNGVPPFITSSENGGSPYSYSKYNLCRLSDVVYISLVDTNTDTPPSSKWAPITLGTGLVASNNLSDVASLVTTLTNLGFGGNGSSYFKIPNNSNTAQPWIVQIIEGTGQTSETSQVLTHPVTFPNAVVGRFVSTEIDGGGDSSCNAWYQTLQTGSSASQTTVFLQVPAGQGGIGTNLSPFLIVIGY